MVVNKPPKLPWPDFKTGGLSSKPIRTIKYRLTDANFRVIGLAVSNLTGHLNIIHFNEIMTHQNYYCRITNIFNWSITAI